MFKKILCVMLSALMLVSIAACGKTEDETQTPAVYEGTLEDLAAAIYEKHPIEAMMGPTTQIDLTSPDNTGYYLGITDVSAVKEAVFSEPMIGSIPYSLCLVRVKEDADIAAVKQSIFDGIDTRKWMCVEADNLVVASCADIVLMVMTNKEQGETLSQDLCAAFAEIVGGEVSKLEK